MIPQKEEYLEALQQDVNNERDKFINSLPEDDQKKFMAVSKAMDILSEAKVLCYFFPFLPAQFSDKDKIKLKKSVSAVYQYNNIISNLSYDEKGNVDLKSQELLSTINCSLLSAVYQLIVTSSKKEIPIEQFKNFIETVDYALRKESNRIYGKE